MTTDPQYDPLEPAWVQAQQSADNGDYLRSISYSLLQQNAILSSLHEQLRDVRKAFLHTFPLDTPRE